MKVVLNLKRLMERKLITSSEASRLQSLSVRPTFQFAGSLLMVFGIAALAFGVFSNNPTPTTTTLVGVALLVLGVVFAKVKSEYSWCFVSFAALLGGAFLTSSGIGSEFTNMEMAELVSSLLFIIVAVIANSGLLAMLSALTLTLAVSGTNYDTSQASYFFGLESILLTILVFTILGTFAYQWAKRLGCCKAKIARTFARMSLVVINFAFLSGALNGDTVGAINYDSMSDADYTALMDAQHAFLPSWFGGAVVYSPDFFAVVWAVVIVLVGIWAVKRSNVFTLNTVVLFAAIHFYSQWFLRFGTESWSLLVAGGVAVLIAGGLSMINCENGCKVASMKEASTTTPSAAPVMKKTVKKVAKKAAASKVVAKKAPVKKAAAKKVAKKAVKKVTKKK